MLPVSEGDASFFRCFIGLYHSYSYFFIFNMMDIHSLSANEFHQSPSSSLQCVNDNWNKIPLFDGVEPLMKEGQLVRFRGMVQDMPNPVFYYSKYEVCHKTTGKTELRSGKYIDSLCCELHENLNLESTNCETEERRLYLLVPVPAVSEWAQIKPDANKRIKNLSLANEPEASAAKDSKRSSDDMEIDADQNELSKRLCKEQPSAGKPDERNKTLSDSKSGCLVLVYDTEDGVIKLNEVLEVAGFIYREAFSLNEIDEFDDSYKPPSPFTPRIHAVAFKKITNFNPLVESVESINNKEIISQAETLRSDLHLALSQLFFGDRLVADYVICHLISRIYHRSDADVILGKFSLNISQLPQRYFSEEVFKTLRKLVPKVMFLPFTIENLNKTRLLPKKNYSTGNLDSGILQLSDNTHIVVDETQLTEGKLEDTGVKNVNALKSLIKRQQIDYDFTYYQVGFKTDIPILILSRTKSILPSDIDLPLVPDENFSSKMEESFDAVSKFLNDDLLKKIRVYLSVAASLQFNLPEEYQTIIQEEFVRIRQEDPSFSGNDLHELLVLCRLLSISYCQSSLTPDVWAKAKTMLIERRSRVSQM